MELYDGCKFIGDTCRRCGGTKDSVEAFGCPHGVPEQVEKMEVFPISDEDFLKNNPVGHPVNHPPHYTSDPSGVECIEITQHRNFCIGNAMKYLWRSGLKGDSKTEDLEKAIWYINKEIERLGGTNG